MELLVWVHRWSTHAQTSHLLDLTLASVDSIDSHHLIEASSTRGCSFQTDPFPKPPWFSSRCALTMQGWAQAKLVVRLSLAPLVGAQRGGRASVHTANRIQLLGCTLFLIFNWLPLGLEPHSALALLQGPRLCILRKLMSMPGSQTGARPAALMHTALPFPSGSAWG